MIIDFHTHCFPDTLAPHALDAMSSAAALYPQTQGIKLKYDGTLEQPVCPQSQRIAGRFCIWQRTWYVE